MYDNDSTIKFSVDLDKSQKVNEILSEVFQALNEKGYNPISQMVGYIISGDPTYITSHNNEKSNQKSRKRRDTRNIVKKYLEQN